LTIINNRATKHTTGGLFLIMMISTYKLFPSLKWVLESVILKLSFLKIAPFCLFFHCLVVFKTEADFSLSSNYLEIFLETSGHDIRIEAKLGSCCYLNSYTIWKGCRAVLGLGEHLLVCCRGDRRMCGYCYYTQLCTICNGCVLLYGLVCTISDR